MTNYWEVNSRLSSLNSNVGIIKCYRWLSNRGSESVSTLTVSRGDLSTRAGVRVSGQGFRHQAGRSAATKNTLPPWSYWTPAAWRTFHWTHSTDQGSGCGNLTAVLTEFTDDGGHDSLMRVCLFAQLTAFSLSLYLLQKSIFLSGV